MNIVQEMWSWLTSTSSWGGAEGIGTRLAQHVGYSLLALAFAAIIGIGVGIYVGHTGKGQGVVLGTSGILRAMPTLGLLTFLALVIPSGVTVPLLPATVVLVILAVPSVLAATASGILAIDRNTVDAAKAMGYSSRQIITDVELPLALPVLVGGIRSAWLQVVATATVSAYLGLGGLGRYLLDALAVRDYAVMLGAAIIVAALALVTDMVLAVLQKISVPAGMAGGEV